MTIIAIYISKYYTTGGHKRYLEVLNGLAERGHNVLLFHRSDNTSLEKVAKGISLVSLECKTGKIQQKSFTNALKKQLSSDYLLNLKADLVLLFGESSILSGIYLKRKLDIPLIIALRNNFYIADHLCHTNRIRGIIKDLINQYKESLIKKNGDLIIFQNEYDRDSYINRNRYPISQTVIIPNSTRASWLKESLRNTNRSTSLKHIMFIGSNDRRKGFHLLISALNKLKTDGYDFTLSVVGSFPDTGSEQMPVWVNMLGRVESPLQLLSESDLLIVPSLYDSFPNTVLEALFVGTPVIGTDIAGIKTILHYQQLLFEGDNDNDLCNTLRPLFHHEEYLRVKELCRERLPLFDFDWIHPWEKTLKEL